MSPRDRLRHHVTGAIERGEAVAITEQRPMMTRAEANRMLELERARDEVIAACEAKGSGAALAAWDEIHKATLDHLHAMERADIRNVRAKHTPTNRD